jgi:hypothetical protein
LARLPRAGFKAHHDREDHDYRDDGSNQDDEDHDGISKQYETSDGDAHQTHEDAATNGGDSIDYTVPADANTSVLVALTEADNPTTPVSVEIIDPNGVSLTAPISTPGSAVATAVPTGPGNYTVKVRNQGLTATTTHTSMITRKPPAVLP